MSKSKRTFGNVVLMLLKIFLAGVLALAILSGVCFLISFSGIHIHNDTGATDYKWAPHQWKSTVFESYSWINMDENGFSNENVYPRGDIDVLVMGSSHMEAAQLPPAKHAAGLLDAALEENVYNIGISGHTLYTCVKNIQNAMDEYAPSDFVIIETATIDLSVSQMQEVLAGEYATIPSYDSGVLYYLQKYVPALKTLYKNISDWRDAEADKSESVVIPTDESDYAKTLREFLRTAASPVKANGAQLIIFYHPQFERNDSGEYTLQVDQQKMAVFQDACKNEGIIFLDMSEAFTDMYMCEHVFPHGFSNSAVAAGHLNEYGHQAIAAELIKAIEENS